MIDDIVDNDGDTAGVRFAQQNFEVRHRAVLFLDGTVVLNGVTVIVVGAFSHRHQPDAGHAERLQVVEARYQPLQVADSIAIGVLVAAYVDLDEAG